MSRAIALRAARLRRTPVDVAGRWWGGDGGPACGVSLPTPAGVVVGLDHGRGPAALVRSCHLSRVVVEVNP